MTRTFRRSLVIVCVLLLIIGLGLIGLSNFLSSCTRSHISVARSNMRTLATAIESYCVDNNSYPPHTFDAKFKVHWPRPIDAPTFDMRISLSTPIGYIVKYYLDPYHEEDEKASGFAYFSNGRGWFLVSPGPDRDYDTPFRFLHPDMVYMQTQEDGSLKELRGAEAIAASLLPYDPTNGIDSSGDLYHLSWGDTSLSWIDYQEKDDAKLNEQGIEAE